MNDPGSRNGETRRPTTGQKWPARKVGLWLLGLIAVVLSGWALRAVGVVVVPLIFSLLIALMIAPVDRAVQSVMPRGLKWLGHVAAMSVIVVILAAFAGGIWVAAQRVVAQFPQISEELQSVASLTGAFGEGSGSALGQASGEDLAGSSGAASTSGVNPDGANGSAADDTPGFDLADIVAQFRGAGGQLGSRLADWAAGYATSILGSAGSALGALVLIFFFVLLMLIEAPVWRAKASRIFPSEEETGVRESFAVIAGHLRRYLLVRVFLGLITGALYAGWLWLFGVDLLIVWGLLAFLLNFVPTLGSLIAGALPVVYVLVQRDVSTALLIGAGILVIEQVMGNYVDPRVQGRQLSLSPLVILVVILVWGWMWGVAGALLAVPVTISLVVVFAHFPRMRATALLLSDESDYRGLDRLASRD